MSIKKYNSTKDNTIVNSFRENLSARGSAANLGASDILELFSIFGQVSTSSIEKSRILVEFPISDILRDRNSSILPASGSAKYMLKLFNTPHGQTTPENYTIAVHPIVQSWTEGDGLDMESYLDLEASNWLSASEGVSWNNTGSDFVSSAHVTQKDVPLKYTQFIEAAPTNASIDITAWVEEWLKYENSAGTQATASITFSEIPDEDEVITIYSHEAQKNTFTFITASSYSAGGSVYYVNTGSTAAAAASNLESSIQLAFSNKMSTSVNSTLISLTQSVAGFHGNTIISSSITSDTASFSGFGGGTGLPNYGLVLKLEDEFEDGSKERSYYTKKFYSRSSHEFFLKPQIEVQWDDSIKDDRNYIVKSSSLAPASDNLNSIYYYNHFRGNLVDIPNTGSRVVVQFYPELGGDATSVVDARGNTGLYITASKPDTGIYKASFAYSGSNSTLQEVWKREVAEATGSATLIFDSKPVNDTTLVLIDTLANSASFKVDNTIAGTNILSNLGLTNGKKYEIIENPNVFDFEQFGAASNNVGETFVYNGDDIPAGNEIFDDDDAEVAVLSDEDGNIIIATASDADGQGFALRLHGLINGQSVVQITSSQDPQQEGNLSFVLVLNQDNVGSSGNTTIQTTFGSALAAGTSERFTGGVDHEYINLVTGSSFTIHTDDVDTAYPIPNYVVNITNLKQSYLQEEKATFRVYTRNKNWQPNIYTKARNSAPIDTIRDMYYKVVKISNNYEIIGYSTGSSPSYSSLSYDKQGSYFELDMTLLEKNNGYEISFLFKDGNNYLELPEKFRFRVDP